MPRLLEALEVTDDGQGNYVPASFEVYSGGTLTATAETKTYYIQMPSEKTIAGEPHGSWISPPDVLTLTWTDPAAANCTISVFGGASAEAIVASPTPVKDVFGTDVHDIDPNTAVPPLFIDVSADGGGPYDYLAVEIVADTGLTVKCALLR